MHKRAQVTALLAQCQACTVACRCWTHLALVTQSLVTVIVSPKVIAWGYCPRTDARKVAGWRIVLPTFLCPASSGDVYFYSNRNTAVQKCSPASAVLDTVFLTKWSGWRHCLCGFIEGCCNCHRNAGRWKVQLGPSVSLAGFTSDAFTSSIYARQSADPFLTATLHWLAQRELPGKLRLHHDTSCISICSRARTEWNVNTELSIGLPCLHSKSSGPPVPHTLVQLPTIS